jgi:hypothetical protein
VFFNQNNSPSLHRRIKYHSNMSESRWSPVILQKLHYVAFKKLKSQ